MFSELAEIISQNASINQSKGRAKATGRRPEILHRAATRSWAPTMM
jgi:hypothetical protein